MKITTKLLYWALAVLLLNFAPANAQRASRIPRIGFLATVSRSTLTDRVEAFRRGLRELGYVEGKNIIIEWRFADGEAEVLSRLAADLVRLNVALVVTAGSPPTQAIRQATSTIPIVMGLDPDPVGNGFVSSLARPGGNITGLSTLSSELSGRQLEILKEILPKLSKVGVLGSSIRPGNAQALKEAELAAAAFRVRLQYLNVITSSDVDPALRAAKDGHAEALLVFAAPAIRNFQKPVVELAAKYRIPAMYERAEYITDGGLISYGASMTGNFRRAATYVDKILKGTKPADLPVEQPTKFELLINLKAAKQIGLTIPPNVLARADRVVR
jgi:putative ABC transport system substrate-binding protein